MILLNSAQIKELWDSGWLTTIRYKGGQHFIEGRVHKVKTEMYQKDAKAYVRVHNIKDAGNRWELTLRRVSVYDYLKERKAEEVGQMDIFNTEKSGGGQRKAEGNFNKE